MSKKMIVDVDVVISKYNIANPTNKIKNNGQLAELVGCHKQKFTTWKIKAPDVVHQLVKLAEIGDCNIEDFITEVKDEN